MANNQDPSPDWNVDANPRRMEPHQRDMYLTVGYLDIDIRSFITSHSDLATEIAEYEDIPFHNLMTVEQAKAMTSVPLKNLINNAAATIKQKLAAKVGVPEIDVLPQETITGSEWFIDEEPMQDFNLGQLQRRRNLTRFEFAALNICGLYIHKFRDVASEVEKTILKHSFQRCGIHFVQPSLVADYMMYDSDRVEVIYRDFLNDAQFN